MEAKRLLDLESLLNGTGIGLDIIRLESGERISWHDEPEGTEAMIVVLAGGGTALYWSAGQERQRSFRRSSLLDERPTAFTFSTGTGWVIRADENLGLELAVVRTENAKEFSAQIIRAEDVSDEERGQGLAGGTMHRKVRAVFGDPLAPVVIPESELIVGEVVTFPGRWSSYPPHGHPHPEMYYYRFPEGGFGVSVLGDGAQPDAATGRIVRDGDVEQILDGFGHAQTAAPGYPMWYLWVVRHLPGNRYEGNPPFSFYEAHEWVNDPDAEIWTPNS